jgi:anthranilate synthase/aminodeoxychorismate synthase-like glutamine amidotransferase
LPSGGSGGRRQPRLLLVDNYDSFTFNLAHLFGELGADVAVIRNDDERLDPHGVGEYDGVVIGPGPGRPREAGKTFAVLASALERKIPVFGVCLGAQAIGEYFGGTVTYAPALMHGKTSQIAHDGSGVFRGVESPFTATRYHSLCVAREDLPAALTVTATSEDGVIQGLAHRSEPVHGVQFHPESVLTTEGRRIFENFLALTRLR